jgi:glycolate oxidase iron-sulfur subunit
LDVDAIVTNAAGCGSGMHEYHLILKGTEHERQAAEFRKRVCDVSLFLDRLGDLPPFPERDHRLRIAYHDACHLANAQGVRAEPRRLLRLIPGVDVCEISDSHLCCGSAGTYNIDQPEIADALGEEKVNNVLALRPDIVATGNIGCMTQLATHLSTRGSNLEVRHTMQVLRDAYRN